MLPAIHSIAGELYVFRPDSEPAHSAHLIVELLCRETPDFIAPDMWPANSQDLNPVDYRIWGLMQERVYRSPIRDVAEQRKRLMDTWARFQQDVMDEAVKQWRKRLRARVRAREGPFEHIL